MRIMNEVREPVQKKNMLVEIKTKTKQNKNKNKNETKTKQKQNKTKKTNRSVSLPKLFKPESTNTFKVTHSESSRVLPY